MEIKFTAGTLIGFGLGTLAGYFLPLILWIIWKRKTGTGAFPFISGIVAYILISLARMIIKIIFFRGILRNYFTEALISGICEEFGRMLVFRYVLYEYKNPENSVSYGIGHSGLEILMVFGINGLSFRGLILGLGYTFMDTDKFLSYGSWTQDDLVTYLTPLAETGFGGSFLTILSVITGLAFSIELSLLVFTGVHSDDWKKNVLIAAGIHTLDNFLRAEIFGADISLERVIFEICITAGVGYYVYTRCSD